VKLSADLPWQPHWWIFRRGRVLLDRYRFCAGLHTHPRGRATRTETEQWRPVRSWRRHPGPADTCLQSLRASGGGPMDGLSSCTPRVRCRRSLRGMARKQSCMDCSTSSPGAGPTHDNP